MTQKCRPDPEEIFMASKKSAPQRSHEIEMSRQQHQELLEAQVLERTAALTQANQQLQQEIIERQQAETALAAERNWLRTLVDNLPDLIYVKDIENRFLLVNTAVVQAQ